MPRNFPNFIEKYLEHTKGHESTRRIRLWCAISIVAAALERKVVMDRGYYLLFPNHYIFIIGRSGLVKKTTSTGIAVDLLREVEGVRIMSERLTSASLIEQLLMSAKTYEVERREYKQSAIFAYASELQVFLEEVYGDIVALLTTFYDCVPNDSTKAWVYGTIGRGERKIFGPCLNILGASTKAWLRKCIPTSEIEGGFTSRIMFVCEDNLPETLVAWPETGDLDGLTRLRLIDDLRQINQMVGDMTPTKEAKELFSKWYEHHMRRVLPYSQDPRMIGYMSRKGDSILKLAMVHSAACSDSRVVTPDNLRWANKEIDDLEKDWRMAFDGAGLKNDLAFDALDLIQKHGFIERVELLKKLGDYAPMKSVVQALRELSASGDVVEHNKAGRQFLVLPGHEKNISL